MVNPIPNFVKNIWNKWDIRGVILTSLSLQIFLIFLAPLRKRTRKTIVVLLLWSAYLFADCAASFCVGLISNKYGDQDDSSSASTDNDFLLAFWAPFLLLHLGGPDTITSFALEDNELWLRHLLGLIFQVTATGYVFLLTLPANPLWPPTALVFLAGIIKFFERTRSLQLASISTFRQSMVRDPDPGPNYAKLMEEYKSREESGLPSQIVNMPEPVDQTQPEPGSNNAKLMKEHKSGKVAGRTSLIDQTPKPEIEAEAMAGAKAEAEAEATENANGTFDTSNDKVENLDDVIVVRKAYEFFTIFQGLVVDKIFSFQERNKSYKYFLNLTAVDALRVVEVELNFIYGVFYTKVSVVRSKVGFFFRFVCISSVVAALVLFTLDEKHGFNEFDVIVTYTLLYGAVALDAVAVLMLIFSDNTVASFNNGDSQKRAACSKIVAFVFECFLKLKKPKWSGSKGKETLSRHVLFCRWSGSISGFNLISYCIQQTRKGSTSFFNKIVDYVRAKEFLDKWKYEKKNRLLQELWIFIFRELKRKSADAEDVETIQRICSARGAWVIQEGELKRDEIDSLMPFIDASEVTFDESLILWHTATHLLLQTNVEKAVVKQSVGHSQDIEKGGVLKTDHHVEKGGVHKNDQDAGKGGIHKNDQDAGKGGIHKNGQDVGQGGVDTNHLRDFSKHLSDYMLYLLIMQPTMMSAIVGIGQIRFQDTSAEAIKFFSKRDVMAKDREKNAFHKLLDAIKSSWKSIVSIGKGNPPSKDGKEERKEENIDGEKQQKEACKKLLDVCTDYKPSLVKGDRSKSLLFDACRLAKALQGLDKKTWIITAQVWVELLSFAASNCRPMTHVQQLSKGAEFVSLVWLLMTHLGLGKQFQIKEGHARAKLIVGD